MNQKEFTNYIIPKLIRRFPQFCEFCTQKPNDIVDIDYKSPNGELTLWVTTQDKEITIGFNSEPPLHDWHIHMSQLNANTPREELEAAVKLLENILTDGEAIVASNIMGHSLIYDINDIENYKEEGEIIRIVYWSDL